MKVIFKTVIFFLLMIISIHWGIYYWMNNAIDRVLNAKQKTLLIEEIQNTPPLPNTIYLTLEKYYPEVFETNSWSSKQKRLFSDSPFPCPCLDLYIPTIYGARNDNSKWVPSGWTSYIIALYLDQKFTQKQCLAYSLNSSDFGSNVYGIKDAAHVFFDKQVEKLTEKEIISLIVISEAPSFYSPRYHKKRLEKKVTEIISSSNEKVSSI